ncbi:tyrosine-type recombinase/integrase [Novosphingobium sp. ZW T3_23]|uniref:tyrosine-type recombinase/integrase n=1 Tax=Novosphingobium sp. ZW T3_23 TaxID=3378084 RepID=UPI003852F580
MPWTVYNRFGHRKYLTSKEIDAFVQQAGLRSADVKTFCRMIAFTGCRISEALSLTQESIDFEARQVIIRCLKKRGRRIFRAVPLPSSFLKDLQNWLRSRKDRSIALWPWSRMTGYRRVCEVMESAGVRGDYASPKGLRHGFGVRAIQAGVPLTLVQRWLGHADIKTTAIYTSAVGPEEREIASRMWRKQAAIEPIRPTQAAYENEGDFVVDIPPAERLERVAKEEGDRVSLESRDKTEADSLLQKPSADFPANTEKPSPALSNLIGYCSLIHFWLYCRLYCHSKTKTYDPPLTDFPERWQLAQKALEGPAPSSRMLEKKGRSASKPGGPISKTLAAFPLPRLFHWR